jgi:hypothetical protein
MMHPAIPVTQIKRGHAINVPLLMPNPLPLSTVVKSHVFAMELFASICVDEPKAIVSNASARRGDV